ncbi:phage virion morphogenesis protein [Salmonella enterica]|nr:phage virion morphogenesis protein [Salmonella enterica]EAU9594363.1 phage virion morphogenesis protein [Salmonella enterica]ECR3286682.1 phage virion morphogenesis protein [Salmonella enterica]ECR8353362.1 phage virion morphogenesis protein [Salmonella enterica]EGN0305417.1 phage virion morphogenesis protein [Salmonella enterica]
MKQTMMQLTVKDGPLRRALKNIAAAGTDMTPLMRAIAGTLATETAVNFEEEGRPPWVPSLAAQKRDGMTLSDTGHLQRSITTAYDARSAVIGTNVAYARLHQLGGTVKRRARDTLLYRRTDEHHDTVLNGFVKKRQANYVQKTRIGDHTATYPARPFLPVNTDGSLQDGVEQKLLDTALRYLQTASRR